MLFPGTTRAADPLKIAYSDWPGWVAWEVAIQKGFFKDEGVDVQFTWLEYAPSMDAFSANKVDACLMTNGDAMVTGEAGRKSTGILLTDYSNGNDMIVGKPGINSIKDLKGKKIGVEVTLVEHLMLLKALESNGMQESDVTLVKVATNDTPQTLASGSVDAIGRMRYPLAGQALKQVAGSKALFTSAEVPGLIYDGLYVGKDSLAARKADWAKVTKVWFKTVAYIQDPKTHDDAVKIMAARIKMTPEDYDKNLKGTFLLDVPGNVKAYEKRDTLDSVYGSSKIADAFYVKNEVYKKPADIDSYLDSAWSKILRSRTRPADRHCGGFMAAWLAIRKPVTGPRGTLLKVLAFLIPLAVWCAISYCPFIWHPLVEVTVPGDSGLEAGLQCDPAVLADINRPLLAQGKKPAEGVPSNPRYLPPPHRVAKALYTAFSTKPYYKSEEWFHTSLLHSVQVIFWGFSAAMVLAIPIGIFCGTFDLAAKLTEPFVDFVRYMPPPTFGALMMAIWGIFDAPKIAIIFIGCMFNMVLVTANTTRTLDVSLLEAAQTLGATRLSLITHVILPGVLPGIYKDVRICLGAAWTFLTAAELVGNMSGLSAFINQQQKHQQFDNVYAGIIVIGVLGFVIDQTLAFIGTLIFPWTPEANHKARRWFRWLEIHSFVRTDSSRCHAAHGGRPQHPFTKPRDSSSNT